MSRFTLLLCVLTTLVVGQGGSNIPQSEVVLTGLAKPAYPRLARQARVQGDVVLKVAVRRDGTVESAESISGPAMLVQAALDSARNSKFDCSSCTEAVTSYRLVYSFQFGPEAVCAKYGVTDELVDQGYPQVTQTKDRVILIDQPIPLCNGDVMPTPRKVRSAKCLYLWKCGHR